MNSSVQRDVAAARRHAALRWVGAPLLLTGVCGIVAAILGFVAGGSGWIIGVAMFGTGLGLASFGANHDAAMALALKANEAVRGGESGLPPALAGELREELARDRGAVFDLRASPKIAMAMPLLALLVQGLLLRRLLGH